jgi:hypothetical protein
MGKTLRIGASVLALAVGSANFAAPARATGFLDKALTHLNTGPLTFLHFIFYVGLLDIMSGDDPALAGGVARHNGYSATVAGAPARFSGGRSTFFSGFLWGNHDFAPSLGLPPNQQLFVGAFYRHSRAATDFGSDGRSTGHGHALGAFVGYAIDAWRFSVAGGYEWGGGTLTSLPSNATGAFDTNGYSFGFSAGRSITLRGDPAVTNRDDPWPHSVKQASVYFDPVFRLGYSRAGGGAFVNSRGTPFGSEVERAWTIGGSFGLSAIVPHGNGVVIRPHVAFTIERQVDYRHTLGLPATGQTASLTQDRTHWGVKGGVAVWFDRSLSVGADGFHRASGSQQASGAMAWLRVNLFGPGGYFANTLAAR